MPFRNRREAGRRLAERLMFLRGADAVVLALPRGGVPVAFEVARALDAPLDVIIVRKLGVPSHPELAMGAIGEGGVRVINASVVRTARISESDLNAVEQRERQELERRTVSFRKDRVPVDLTGRTAIIVDDGLATGSTARAACQIAWAHRVDRAILAVPVAPPGAFVDLARLAEVVAIDVSERLGSVGQAYDDFTQTSDTEVARLLSSTAAI
jgi:putative phosphoribosyl transferase